MAASFLDAIDWQQPWLSPIRAAAAPILQRPEEWLAALNGQTEACALRNYRGLPIRFVSQASLPSDKAYEEFIGETGGVPTRENLHDFFNALVWHTFPRIKVRLNALQATEIASARVCGAGLRSCGARRGRLRDAATLFDESAALFVASDSAMIEAVRSHDWRDVFLVHRGECGATWEVWLFGHALMEKLVNPYKAITAHAWPVVADRSFFEMGQVDKASWLDGTVEHQLNRTLSTADLMPLPLLGIPGWHEGQDEDFYADTAVFRPKRTVLPNSGIDAALK